MLFFLVRILLLVMVLIISLCRVRFRCVVVFGVRLMELLLNVIVFGLLVMQWLICVLVSLRKLVLCQFEVVMRFCDCVNVQSWLWNLVRNLLRLLVKCVVCEVIFWMIVSRFFDWWFIFRSRECRVFVCCCFLVWFEIDMMIQLFWFGMVIMWL